MRLYQSTAIKISLTLFISTNLIFSYAQDSILLKNQVARKSREYLSIDVQPLFRTGTKISKTTDKDVLEKLNTPGFSAGVDYLRVSQSGFMFAGGVHLRMIPIAYKFDINDDDFTVGGNSTLNFGKRNSNLINGHFYFPIQAGYTFKRKISKWDPSLMAGGSLSRIQRSLLTSGSSYLDDSNVRHRLQEITAYYSELNPWLTYTLNARASKTLRRGNQIFFALNFNYSPVTYNSGEYSYYPNSGKQTGTFNDTGSYVALQFGFSFVRKYQEPQTY
ncbi:hypothetical protein, partial [Daejeonella sp.]|uniref:hypothetical protein n=1 Tax=Daejeonella sp. TaxID=2805397 RepID=UPI0030C4840A